MVGKVIPQPDGTLMVQASDLLENKQILMEADMVVLAAAIEPDKDARKLATMLTASMDTNDFLTEAHAKLRPVESPTAGIFLIRCLPGTKGYSGDCCTGRRCCSKGNRPSCKGFTLTLQPMCSSF